MVYDYYKQRNGELFVYRNNLYYAEYPLINNKPKILMPDVIQFEVTGAHPSSYYYEDLYILYTNGIIICETTGQEFYLKNAFKISVLCNNLLAIAPHKILYVRLDNGIAIKRHYWRLITDGRAGEDETEHYILIINGHIQCAAVGLMKIKFPYKIIKDLYHTKIFENGFLFNNVFYKTGIPPRKAFFIDINSRVVLIDDSLYYFKNIDNNESISMFLINGIDDVFYSYHEKQFFYFDRKGKFYVLELDEVDNIKI